MKRPGASAMRIALWIAAAVAVVAAAAGAYFQGHPRAARKPAAPPPVAAVQPAPPPSEEPSGPAPIPFAPRIYPATPIAPSEPARPPGMPAPSGAAAPASPAAPAAMSGPFSASAALPAGTPAARVLEQLRSAADAGDAAAACRVGLELLRCTQPAIAVGATTRGPAMASASCAGITPEEAQAGWSYISRAAGAGNPVAARVAASRAFSGVSPAECGR
ncbi:MAG TPA: hypothetical protein VLS49_08840 [Usitatibacter sp.]|nr:hypothetical protein [Usitatibacter sp.]